MTPNVDPTREPTASTSADGNFTPEVPLAFPEIVALYERDVDLTLLRENLKLNPAQRLAKLEEFTGFLDSLRRARVIPEAP